MNGPFMRPLLMRAGLIYAAAVICHVHYDPIDNSQPIGQGWDAIHDDGEDDLLAGLRRYVS